MGNTINTTGHELCPYVTGDGKYFFYTSNQDIYWIDARINRQPEVGKISDPRLAGACNFS